MGHKFKLTAARIALGALLAVSAGIFFANPGSALAGLFVLVAVWASLKFFNPLGVEPPWEQMGADAGAAFMDMAAAQPMLKEYYEGAKVENLADQKNVALAMMPRDTDAEGKYVTVPTVWEVGQGISSNFALAQLNQTPNQFVEFMIPLRPDYAVHSITEQARLSSGSNVGAFMKMATSVIDGALQGSAKSASSALYRSGTGSVGAISTIASGVITLTNPADIAQFSVNQVLQANSTDGGSPRAALGYVIARSVMAGTITVSTVAGGAAGSPTGWTAADFLVRQGDNNAKMTGFAAWLPLTAPTTTDNFYGVNRSVDTRLFGLAYPGSQAAIEETLIDASMLVAREGGDPRHHFTSFGTQSALDKALGARREFVSYEKNAVIGFRGIRIQGPMGDIESYADYSCQQATGWLLQLDTWKLYSVGGSVPTIKKYLDGQDFFRISNADAMEIRVGYFGNVGCRAPGWNSQITYGA